MERGAEIGAIDQLAVLDTMLHSSVDFRNRFETVAKNVRNFGGKVLVISSNHPYKDQILHLGGLVGILRFPLPL